MPLSSQELQRQANDPVETGLLPEGHCVTLGKSHPPQPSLSILSVKWGIGLAPVEGHALDVVDWGNEAQTRSGPVYPLSMGSSSVKPSPPILLGIKPLAFTLLCVLQILYGSRRKRWQR